MQHDPDRPVRRVRSRRGARPIPTTTSTKAVGSARTAAAIAAQGTRVALRRALGGHGPSVEAGDGTIGPRGTPNGAGGGPMTGTGRGGRDRRPRRDDGAAGRHPAGGRRRAARRAGRFRQRQVHAAARPRRPGRPSMRARWSSGAATSPACRRGSGGCRWSSRPPRSSPSSTCPATSGGGCKRSGSRARGPGAGCADRARQLRLGRLLSRRPGRDSPGVSAAWWASATRSSRPPTSSCSTSRSATSTRCTARRSAGRSSTSSAPRA